MDPALFVKAAVWTALCLQLGGACAASCVSSVSMHPVCSVVVRLQHKPHSRPCAVTVSVADSSWLTPTQALRRS
jgi:hypothetical protein